jgi:hypothetical protein
MHLIFTVLYIMYAAMLLNMLHTDVYNVCEGRTSDGEGEGEGTGMPVTLPAGPVAAPLRRSTRKRKGLDDVNTGNVSPLRTRPITNSAKMALE